MTKAVQVVAIVATLVVGVVIGAKYSEGLKNNFSWMSESKDEVALPDLSNEEIDGASQDVLNNNAKDAEKTGEIVAPADSVDEAAPAAESSAPAKK